jgi:hypothetical protein
MIISTKNHFKFLSLASITILTVLLAVPVETTYGSSITHSVDPGSNTLCFRDIAETDPRLPSVNLDNFIDNLNGIGTVDIDDFSANLDCNVKDFVSGVIVQPSSSTTVDAEETEISSGLFHGEFLVTDEYNSITLTSDTEANVEAFFVYEPGPVEAVRSEVEISMLTAGNVTFSDVSSELEESNLSCEIRPVTDILDIKLEDGTLTADNFNVTISYANGALEENDDVTFLEMFYQIPGFGWSKISDRTVNPEEYNDLDAETVTSAPIDAGFAFPVQEGRYVIGFDVGCSGGGGGGLVRPSLVVNALAGLGGAGGGGSAYSSPQLNLGNLVLLDWIDVPLEVEEAVVNHDSTNPAIAYDLSYFEDFDYPLVINDKGFLLSGFTTTLETQKLEINTPHTIKFLFYESEIIQHFSLYTNLRDATNEIYESDTQILYFANQELEVVDPNGFFESVTLSINELDDNKKEVVLDITFAKTMDTSHVIVRSWDPNLYSGDNHILDAWEIVSDETIEPPIPSYEEPIIEELKSQTIPIWIKNNAAWWSEQQISDKDFVEGIEYLIKNGIINVPGVEVTADSDSTEIPHWIQNNAGWWSESLITDDDFVQAMQWLISNGVIQI